MEKPKEKHVTFVLGVPLIEKHVYDVNTLASDLREKHREKPSEKQQSSPFLPNGLPSSVWPTTIIVGAIVVLILAYFTFQYIAIRNCPEKLRLDISEEALEQYKTKLNDLEGELTTTKQLNDKLKDEVARHSASNNDLEGKLQKAEAGVSSLKSELESSKQQESKLKMENTNLKSEKESLSKDLDATKYTLGNCKNKNMDHEVRSLELLQEIEGLKKELKAC